MTSPRVCKRGSVMTSALLVATSLMAITGGSARADLVFRKKAPAATDTGLEGSPSGGEPAAEAAGVPAATAPQSEDKDYPELQADKEKKAADAALARQARKAQLDREKEKGTPLYEKWEFWAITGAVVVGAVLTVWGGSAILHQMNGGDIQGCPATATDRCFGQGR
ncbi:MAG: hypothetical protein JWM82_2348 [Myxococcales bacterium]|nr:hypothetical protein [Myxococcales bacterium]